MNFAAIVRVATIIIAVVCADSSFSNSYVKVFHSSRNISRAMASTCQSIVSQKLLPLDKQSSSVYGQQGVVIKSNHSLQIINVAEGQIVIDLSCRSIYKSTFYHRLIDCFVPAMCAVRKALKSPNALVLVPHYLLDVAKYFLNESTQIVAYTDQDKAKKPYGLNMSSPEAIELISPNKSVSLVERQLGLVFLQQQVASKYPNITEKSRHLVLIHRVDHTRCFQNVNGIFARFTKELNMSGVVYFGNESFARTVEIFANARVIIGYHGAGAANAIFAPTGTILLEYTTFHQMEALRLWRSNQAVASLHPGLTWMIYGIDVDRLTDLQILAKSTDKDHYLKSIKHVVLTGATIYNSIQRIKDHLAVSK